MSPTFPERFVSAAPPFLACLLATTGPDEAVRSEATFQTFDDAKPGGRTRGNLARTLHGTFTDLVKDLEALNQAGAGVFVSICSTDGKGRKKTNIQASPGFWCDVDLKGARLPLDIGTLPLPPTMVVRTPGGFHLYWLTNESIQCSDEYRRAGIEAQNRAIAQHLEPFGGDLKACDVARVLRVPGFLHQKKDAAPVQLDLVDGPRYTPDQIREAFPPLLPKGKQAMEAQPECLAPPQRPGIHQRAAAYLGTLPPAISGRGGHGATFDAALKIISGFDLSEDEAVSLLADHFNPRCVPPWSLQELRHKVQDAASRAQSRGHLLQASHNRRRSLLPGVGEHSAPAVAEVESPHSTEASPAPAPAETVSIEVPGFEMSKEGLFRVVHKTSNDGSAGRIEKSWIAPKFTLPGLARGNASEGWKVLVEWKDLDGSQHEESIPFEMISGEGADLARILGQGGLILSPDPASRRALLRYLSLALPRIQGRVRTVDAMGWHDGAFILPDGATIGKAREHMRFAGTVPGSRSQGTRGTLEGWQLGVGRLAKGNPRLVFALACAFSGPLLDLVRPDGGGGFNLMGSSSKGKSTCLEAAASVWCRPDPLLTWRTTTNGLEGIAVTRNDGFLVLDELSQIEPKEAGSIAYMLSNGSAKARATKEGGSRPMHQWRVIFLSSGEQSLEDKLSEDGRRVRAGQEVRVPDIPCPQEGMFQTHHDFPTMGRFAEHLKAEARKHYGHAIRYFLKGLSAEWPRRESLVARLGEMEAAWLSSVLPTAADGQVRRVAGRFALVAIAGELAQRMGILPWEPGEASQGCADCFQAWLDRRGHIGASERERGLLAVVDFLAMHGLSRFAEWNNTEAKPVNMAGVRKASESGGIKMEDGWDFFLSPTGWKEACRGFDARTVARDAIAEGILEPSADGSPYQKRKTPHGQGRFYVVRAGSLGSFRNEARS